VEHRGRAALCRNHYVKCLGKLTFSSPAASGLITERATKMKDKGTKEDSLKNGVACGLREAPCYTSYSFKCNCNMRIKLVGDGCQLCNTELAIDMLPQPVELAWGLISDGGFSEDQANAIAEDIYQPLVSLISTLNDKIEQLARCV